ncbi:MAG: flavodoxin family protein [Patescibacteria group bacterium]
MNVTLIYATNSGGTQEAGKIIAEVFSAAGHTVTMKRANAASAADITSADLVILGSCSWERMEGKEKLEGQLQEHMLAFTQTLLGHTYPKVRFAVYGLGDSSYTVFCGAADRLEEVVKKIQGQKVGETLRIDGFFFQENQNEAKVKQWAEQLVKSL